MAEEERRSQVGISQEVRECIKATSECYSVSAETFRYCVEGEMDLRDPQLMRLLIDCCEICQTTQNSLLRGSDLSLMLSAVCVEACEQLAAACRDADGSDEQFTRCAETCDETADCCRRLAV
jgi:hypothetical protein